MSLQREPTSTWRSHKHVPSLATVKESAVNVQSKFQIKSLYLVQGVHWVPSHSKAEHKVNDVFYIQTDK